MKKLLFCSALFLFCGELTTASAALAQKTYAFALGGGSAIPVGKLSDVQASGYNAIGAIAIGLSDMPFGVRFDGIYNTLSHHDATPGGATTSDLRVGGLLVNQWACARLVPHMLGLSIVMDSINKACRDTPRGRVKPVVLVVLDTRI